MLAPYFANDPKMTMGRAVKLHEQYLKSPSTVSKSKGGKARKALYGESTS